MNIVLIGYRGSGKSTVGRLLADRLGMSFVDTDDRVVQHFDGMTIKAIWQQHGEAEFRNVESDVTEQVMAGDNQVIALGGGTVMQDRARAAVASAANTVRFYLHAPAEQLYERIAGDVSTNADRPNLTELGGGLAEVQRVLAEREPTYAAVADHVVQIGQDVPAQVVERIIQGVGIAPMPRPSSAPPPAVPTAVPAYSRPGSTPPTSQLATWSMILGIVSLVSYCACLPLALCAPAAVICGHMARHEMRRADGGIGGSGLALTGLITGYLGVAILVAATLAGILLPATDWFWMP